MRILLTTWGSSGDLHPFLALGMELLRRGHHCALAGNPAWRQEVEALGLEFIAAGVEQRPDMLMDHPELFSSKNMGLNSLRALLNHGIRPVLRPMLDALVAASPRFDLLVAHHFALTAGTAAEISGIPWVTVYLAPGVIPSAYGMPAATHLKAGTGSFWRMVQAGIWRSGRMLTAPLADPVLNEIRKERGLAPVYDALFGHYSPGLALLLFSRHYAPEQPDYPEHFRQAGFCFYDGLAATPAASNAEQSPAFVPSPELAGFLDSAPTGVRPWLFTLGTSAVSNPGGFYKLAAEAMATLPDQRAIFLLGHEKNRPETLPPNVLALQYLPYGWIMPRCGIVAHQCGVGTLSHTLRAGVPSLACPYAFDQPNNAARMEELGVAKRFLPGRGWTARNMRALLLELDQPAYRTRAAILRDSLAGENGPALAAELLEAHAARLESAGVPARASL